MDSLVKAELMDIDAHWHYLASEAERLFARKLQLAAASGSNGQAVQASVLSLLSGMILIKHQNCITLLVLEVEET